MAHLMILPNCPRGYPTGFPAHLQKVLKCPICNREYAKDYCD